MAMPQKTIVRPEERLNAQLELQIKSLTENFVSIVKVAQLGDKDLARVTRETYEVDLHARNIVRSAEALLTLIHELKQALLLHDFKTIGEIQRVRAEELRTQQQEILERIAEFKDNLSATLYELERAYNMSSCKD